MAIKKVYLKKKIEGSIFDIYPRTSADQVDYNATTVSAELATLAGNITTITTATTGTIDTRIAAACQNLYNQIMGITDQDSTPVTAAYDTLKEVAAWIASHGEVATGILSDISALQTAVGDANSGLVKDVSDLQTTVGDSTSGLVKDVDDLQDTVGDSSSGLVKDVADLQSDVGDSNSGLIKDVDDLQTTVGDSTSGLVKDVDDLQTTVGDSNSGLVKGLADANTAIDAIPVVEASSTNGNIVIDSTETTVYTHPASHDADMIVDTNSTHKFVTAAQLTTINNAAAVIYTDTTPTASAMNANDLYMVDVTPASGT